MSEDEIKTEAKALNDHVFVSPHEGATQAYFDSRAISIKDQYRIMDASIRMLMGFC